MSKDVTEADDLILTAERMLAWRRGPSQAAPVRLPEAAVLTHQDVLMPSRRPWRRNPLAGRFSFRAHALNGGEVVLASPRGVGAPATAIAIEELAASGVRRLVAVDIGGSIVPTLHTGDVVLVHAGVACDGTSPHYSSERLVHASVGMIRLLGESLTAAGIAYQAGRAWSTDAVYRETPSKLAAARKEGALIADMETGCVLAVSQALGFESAVVLVAADELFDGWQPPSDMSRVNQQLRDVLGVATTCLLS